MAWWLLKTEPETFSFDDLLKKGVEPWDGVRNYQARNYLAQMHKGDACLIYHSGKEKSVVGLAEVATEAYPDPTTTDQRWICVDIKGIRNLPAFDLERMKLTPELSELILLKQSRLSVMPLSEKEFKILSNL